MKALSFLHELCIHVGDIDWYLFDDVSVSFQSNRQYSPVQSWLGLLTEWGMTSKWHGRIARRDEDNARYSIADIIFFIITLPPGFDNGLWDRDRLHIYVPFKSI